LIIVGDSATVAQHPFYARLLDYTESQLAYTSVFEWQWLLEHQQTTG
jgi:hypothetical protein